MNGIGGAAARRLALDALRCGSGAARCAWRQNTGTAAKYHVEEENESIIETQSALKKKMAGIEIEISLSWRNENNESENEK